jgi:hypothetical protein
MHVIYYILMMHVHITRVIYQARVISRKQVPVISPTINYTKFAKKTLIIITITHVLIERFKVIVNVARRIIASTRPAT